MPIRGEGTFFTGLNLQKSRIIQAWNCVEY